MAGKNTNGKPKSANGKTVHSWQCPEQQICGIKCNRTNAFTNLKIRNAKNKTSPTCWGGESASTWGLIPSILNFFIMKNSILTLAMLFASLFAAQAQKNADEATIKALLKAETTAFLKGDVKAEAECWHPMPYSRSLVSLQNGTCLDINADQMKQNNEPGVSDAGATFQNSNYHFRIVDGMAWCTYDQVATPSKDEKVYTHETRLLEKFDGKWKIVAMTVHQYKP